MIFFFFTKLYFFKKIWNFYYWFFIKFLMKNLEYYLGNLLEPSFDKTPPPPQGGWYQNSYIFRHVSSFFKKFNKPSIWKSPLPKEVLISSLSYINLSIFIYLYWWIKIYILHSTLLKNQPYFIYIFYFSIISNFRQIAFSFYFFDWTTSKFESYNYFI